MRLAGAGGPRLRGDAAANVEGGVGQAQQRHRRGPASRKHDDRRIGAGEQHERRAAMPRVTACSTAKPRIA